jgi:hypothetical protein
MQRLTTLWNRGWLGKAIIALVALVLGCCVIGIFIPKQPTRAPAAALASTAAPVPTDQPTAPRASRPSPEPTAEPTATVIPTEQPTAAPAAVAPTAAPKPVAVGAAPKGKDCPADHPIKGNIPTRGANKGEHIYHVPGDNGYASTNPERCFVDVTEAKAAGYRAIK